MINNLDFITITVNSVIVKSFEITSEQKIKHEKWIGRNHERKKLNFVMSWVSEYAWKEVLGQHNIKYVYFGQYIGPVELSPKEDFIVWMNQRKMSLGIRSRTYEQLVKYQEVSYPDDRIRLEKDIISDYIIISSIDFYHDGNAEVRFWGAISKEDFLKAYDKAIKKFSPSNQEQFRLIALSKFSFKLLLKILDIVDKHH